ncbi:hypothetical protein KEM54_005798 [Ascosphaera aggregata]|nr:hypothetical protein KEM54_005798 [Ascosphaera aggregata]
MSLPMLRSLLPQRISQRAPAVIAQTTIIRHRLISTQRERLTPLFTHPRSLSSSRLSLLLQCHQIRAASQFRQQETYFQKFRIHLRDGWERRWESPVQYTLSLGFITVMLGLIGYVVYDRVTRIEPGLSKYPPEVAEPLRRAVYFTEIDKKPLEALQLFRNALVIADHIGMHPFSDEMLGIRLKAADVLEENGMTKSAIEMLERIEADCQEWVETGRRREEIEKWEKETGKTLTSSAPQKVGERKGVDAAEDFAKSEPQSQKAEDPWAGKPWRKEFVNEAALREKIVKKIVGIKLKLAELHMSDDDVQDIVKSERMLVSATEYCLKEVNRRRELGLPLRSSRKDREMFITLKEVAATMNDLADFYAAKKRPDFASLLYMQALALLKEDEGKNITCAQVVLLNNVASQMAEQAQKMHPGRTIVPQPSGPQITREQALAAAQQWAKMAIQVSEHVQPDVKTEECDQSCLVAMYNLGEIAEMLNDEETARDYYASAKKLAESLDFDEGLKNAETALTRLTSKEEKTEM